MKEKTELPAGTAAGYNGPSHRSAPKQKWAPTASLIGGRHQSGAGSSLTVFHKLSAHKRKELPHFPQSERI